MGEDGMHTKNAGERTERSLAHTQQLPNKLKIGFRGIVNRAKLSNAVGYDARSAPRYPRGIHSSNNQR